MLANSLMKALKNAYVEPTYSTNGLLLMPNGINNSVSIIDSSTTHKSISVGGNTKVLTNINPFGLAAGSFYFDGVGDYLSTPSNAELNNFGSGNFVISLWFYVDSANSGNLNTLLICASDYPTTFSFAIIARVGGLLTVALGSGSSGLNYVSPTNTYSYNAWHYLEVNCINNVRRVILDGVILTTTSSAVISIADTATIYLGIFNDASSHCLKGNLAYLRIAKGAIGHTENYTVPTSPPPIA